MDKSQIAKEAAKILIKTKSVLINTKEPFTYTSGKIGPIYVDIRRLISFPAERKILMDYAAEILKPLNMDYYAGGETAGIPYAAFLSERMNAPMLYVRKKPKGHGRMAQIEGHIEDGKNKVLLVEDLLTVGSSQKVFVQALREANLDVQNSFVIFAYGIYPQAQTNLDEMKITLHSLTNWWAVLDVIKEEKYFDTETISSLENFLNAPDDWANNYTQQAS
ncbi:MAG: orotate phosphoribosyltransferase [Alphaproteobacteria bacterium]|nr:orotate phosphoribosyltransferase [Alphaproteobacteria bacterium]